nr:RNA-directed DNA polymerase, eukaryota, reverse transcriptase zinc-binding domain protein [Tanacetum cinerariifolium]
MCDDRLTLLKSVLGASLYNMSIYKVPKGVLNEMEAIRKMDKEISVASKLGSTSVEVSFRRPVRDGVERQQLINLNLLTEYVVGGNWIGMTYFLSLIGMLGSLLFVYRLVSSSFWKVFFTQLGGISRLT